MKITNFFDWVHTYIYIKVKFGDLAAKMFCLFRNKDEIILVDKNSIPDGYTVEDIANLIRGKYCTDI